jgi:HlyD family secretion protein
MKWLRRILLGLVALGVIAAVASAYRPRPRRVEVVRATRGRMVVEVETDGRTSVIDRFVVSAPLRGHLARIDLRPGDPVRAGEVVARLLPAAAPLLDQRSREQAASRLGAAQDALRQARSTAERARIAAEYARRDATRQRDLATRDAVPRQAAELAELELRARETEVSSAGFAARVAAHEVETAQAALGRVQAPVARGAEAEQLDVTAPVNGRVLRVLQQSGGVVEAGAPLLEVGDPAALEVRADVLTTDAVRVRPRARVVLSRWGSPPDLIGSVRLVEPSAFTRVSALGVEEQRVNVLIDLSSPVEQRRALGDGYRVEAHIEVWGADGVLTVPLGALFRQGDAWAVFVIESGRARRRRVQIGERNQVAAQVLSGVTASDVLVAHPDDAITDGALAAPL